MPMSSGGGTSNPRRAYFSMPRERYPDEEDEDGIIEDTELVPPTSLAPIVPILRAADEIQADNPRVAYLCRFVAWEKARAIDPAASVRGVGRFQARLVQRLEKEEMETQRRLASTDVKEVQRFYERYCNKQIEEGVQTRKPDGIATYYQTASVLFDVLKTVTPEKFRPQFVKYGKTLEKEKASLHYNILPLNISGPTQPVMDIPEIKAAVQLLRSVQNLPQPRPSPASVPEEIDEPIICDLFDLLWQTFGFQKSNVENQKEHLILLLANIEMSEGSDFHQVEKYDCTIHMNVVNHLMSKIFQNYISWCRYLKLESNIKIPIAATTQQPELLYIGLYLLIWGEASNVRFMPEYLCYIFHHMAKDLYHLVLNGRESCFDPPIQNGGSDDAFLKLVIQPIYDIIQKEAATSRYGTVSHSKWRNYDDLNEYFWSKNCFEQFGWPADFRSINKTETHANPIGRQSMCKTNFVEVRTFLHLFRSFDRMWAFLTLSFQAMVIIAWNPSGSLSAIFKPDVFRNVLTIFITAAFLNFLQATFDIVLNWKAWRSLVCSQKIRYILKFFVAIAWLIILPTTYIISIQNHTRLVKLFGNHIGNFQSGSVYNFTAFLYMLPNIFSALFCVFLPIKRALERSNSSIARFIFWWTQPKLYVARGMYEDTYSFLKYALFWILLLICKLAFSFYVEICPLVGPTRKFLFSERENHTWHLPFLYCVIITLWAPVVMVYFIDTQIWYAIFSALYGGLNGAFSRLGEIGTLGMLRSKFEAIPRAFSKILVPRYDSVPKSHQFQDDGLHMGEFSDMWNAIISSLRHEDLISNRERNLLIVPSSVGDTTVFQWPPFLLACKIPIALHMAFGGNKKDEELIKMLKKDPYTYYAIRECYETLLNLLDSLMAVPRDKIIVDRIRESIAMSIHSHSVVKDFHLWKLRQLSAIFEKLLNVLLRGYVDIGTIKTQITNLLQDIMEIMLNDIMKNSESIVKGENIYELFANPNLDSINDEVFREKCVRLQLLLTMKESTIYVPTNSEARRRIIFFANSLFMKMPRAPEVHKMMSFSILTPYYKEGVLFSAEDLCKENEDGISILFYLRKMFPDEWHNFLERINFDPKNEDSLRLKMDDICPWASYRGQTLTRTVRGMMHYRRALEIQCIQDKTNLEKLGRTPSSEVRWPMVDMAQAIADIKFTYVVSCQVYGMQKLSKDPKDRACYLNILNLMITYPSLRVAYIDEVEALTTNGTIAKTYYSVLVKGVGDKYDEEIYRIKLPGNPSIGEARAENQNHAIIFTRGEALQAIDMNQDNYLQEAFKMRNLLEEFRSVKYGKCNPTILGLRENIFTGSVSSLAWFFSNQETGFVTIGQRVLANPLKVRFHYGHPDIFDRLFHITRGGISKASKTINLNGDIFSGFNSIMRGGCVTHHEYMEVGKGRDVIMNNISTFEAKVASGNAEQTLSRDVYRLGHGFDFYRMLSFYFSTVGIYFSSMVTVLTVYVFLYGRLYIVASGLERSMLLDPRIEDSCKPLENALTLQAVFQLGLMLVLPMVMEISVEQGFRSALIEFVMMQLQLASVFFTFQLGTRTHYYGRTILHGDIKYKHVGRNFVVYHAKFAENYRMYSRSHFVKGFELLMLLVVYQAYGRSYHSSRLHQFVIFSIWFLVASWLYAPFIFNPSCFDWQKVVADWMDWREWMGKKGGFGMSVEQGWEAWWSREHAHFRNSSIRALVMDIIMSLRFLVYQYAIVYYLNIDHSSRGIPVYALSWLLMFVVLFVLKMVSIAQERYGIDLQLAFRIVYGLIFLGLVSLVIVLLLVLKLPISGLLASIIGFIPAGWCILLIAQACCPLVKAARMWDSIVRLGRAYDDTMGFILYLPIGFLSLFSFVSELQTVLLFSKASTRGIQISRILAGQ
ncbi:hypothetical protein QYE76_060104 [Lolium multiflorum]|uniref:1,3-beta-glucan synthase n=1 Tax=Lolium multiflorum TaxID=4521 RepID=A0AAD8RYD6_LOLMU|nr:hypothetical protein QYE76_060104 [Lolium multiflorum]